MGEQLSALETYTVFTQAVLDKAAGLIQTRGHAKRCYESGTGKLCMAGAINLAGLGQSRSIPPQLTRNLATYQVGAVQAAKRALWMSIYTGREVRPLAVPGMVIESTIELEDRLLSAWLKWRAEHPDVPTAFDRKLRLEYRMAGTDYYDGLIADFNDGPGTTPADVTGLMSTLDPRILTEAVNDELIAALNRTTAPPRLPDPAHVPLHVAQADMALASGPSA